MKKSFFYFSTVLLLTTILTVVVQAKETWPEKLTFGVIPVASSRNMSNSFGSLVQHL